MNIRQLTLSSSNIESIRDFYSQSLDFQELRYGSKEVIYQIGNSTLKFVQKDNSQPYHFAINISTDHVEDAHRWLSERVSLIPDGVNEIIEFESWNARALYFYDVDGNIVELIARRNLNYRSDEEFTPAQFCEVSEIGIAIHPIQNIVNGIKSQLGLSPYKGESDRFTAIGTETGLFICIDPELKKWYPPMDEAIPSAFEASVEIDGQVFSTIFNGKELIIEKG